MKNILITGTSSGVGSGLAKYYLEQGLVVWGISRRNNPELDSHENFRFLSYDLSDLDGVKAKVGEFLSGIEKFDLVILNAGVLNEIKDMSETTVEEIRKVMDVNVWANKVLLDLLFERIGKISCVVAISSGASVSGSRGWNAYSLSKATLNMLVQLYAAEQKDTHFISLAPGLIESGMQDYVAGLSESFADKFPVVAKLQEARGTEKMPSLWEAAKIISYAIEKARNYESGSFLDVRNM